jgi:hypothetical protein
MVAIVMAIKDVMVAIVMAIKDVSTEKTDLPVKIDLLVRRSPFPTSPLFAREFLCPFFPYCRSSLFLLRNPFFVGKIHAGV